MTTIHHLDCGTMCPFAGGAFGGALSPERLVAHCLLVERPDGLVLVDTGFGTDDVRSPRERLGSLFLGLTRPRLEREQTALAHVERLGFDRRDVRDIVVTHLDLDHAGGLSDFPDATVHVYEPEHHAAMDGPTLAERRRYRALQLSHGPKWRRYSPEGDTWRGLGAVRALSDDVLLVPTVGHSRGHVAVAVRDGDGYLLHAGDAYFHHEEMAASPRCPAGLRAFQSIVAFDDRLRLQNQAVLRDIARDHADVRVFSAHSEHELLSLRRERAERGPAAVA